MLELGQYGANVNAYSIRYTNGIYSHPNPISAKAKPVMHEIPSYYFDFEDGDTRRDVTICSYDINSDLLIVNDHFESKHNAEVGL